MRRCIPKADRTHPPSLRGNNFWENRRRHCSALPCVAQPGHFQPFRPLNGRRPGKLKASSGGAVGMEGGAAAAGVGTGSYGGPALDMAIAGEIVGPVVLLLSPSAIQCRPLQRTATPVQKCGASAHGADFWTGTSAPTVLSEPAGHPARGVFSQC
jgi:hypothetical protein